VQRRISALGALSAIGAGFGHDDAVFRHAEIFPQNAAGHRACDNDGAGASQGIVFAHA
jgi:hypothetical protein